MKWLSLAMTAVFGLAVAVQWNDPDPGMWMVLYGAAAAVSAAAFSGRYFPTVTLGLLVLYSAGVLYTAPAVLDSDVGAYTSFKMRSTNDEIARECVGLAVCAAAMLVLWRHGRRVESDAGCSS